MILDVILSLLEEERMIKIKIFKILLGTIGKLLPISYHPLGSVARKFRYFCAKNIVESIGWGVNIEKGATVNTDVIIGNRSDVGLYCVAPSGTIIGNYVMMGPECMIFTDAHKFDKEKLIYKGMTDRKKVIIEDRAWIGARCIILPGVTIGKGSTIGAGSVVTKDVPPYCLAAGNPAKVIKSLV